MFLIADVLSDCVFTLFCVLPLIVNTYLPPRFIVKILVVYFFQTEILVELYRTHHYPK